jgi:hypothetical protein
MNDLREEMQESIRGNILKDYVTFFLKRKDDVTLISFFCGNEGSECKQIFYLDFL